MQFLSSWTWQFTSRLFSNLSTFFSVWNLIHYALCCTYYECYSHVDIDVYIYRYSCSCLFSAVFWVFFMLFHLLRLLTSFEIRQCRNSYNRQLSAYSVFLSVISYWKCSFLFSSNLEFFKMEQSENTWKFLAVSSSHVKSVKEKKSAYLT